MKRSIVIRAVTILLLMVILSAGLPAGAQAEIETISPAGISKMRTLNVLFIGNSYSEDTSRYLYDIVEQTGYRICVGNAWLGGMKIRDHVRNALTDAQVYTYFENSDGNWNQMNDGDSVLWSLSRVLTNRKWDVILLQPRSIDVGRLKSFYSRKDESNPCLLEELARFCREYCPRSHVAYNMTWAHRNDCQARGFKKYGSQLRMCEAAWSVTMSILNTSWETKEVAAGASSGAGEGTSSGLKYGGAILSGALPQKAPSVEFVVPVGTAIQNARSSYMGDTLTRDYKHLNYGIGRYIASMTVAACLGYPVETISSLDLNDTASSLHLPLIKACVMAAVENPFSLSAQTLRKPVLADMNVTVAEEGSRVNLCWNSVKGATSYQVSYRGEDSAESTCVTLDPSETSYEFTGDSGPVYISVCARGDNYISPTAPYETSVCLP